jgi:diacylglycerol O-acyltransferase / wax synthase
VSSPANPPASFEKQPLSSVDYAWLRMDDPTNLMMINGVLALDEPISLEQLRAIVERRLLPIPRFRQRVVVPLEGRPYWQTAEDFDLDDHVVRITLPEPGGEEELRQAIGRLMSSPFDPTKPLWQFHLIENIHGGAVVYCRLHHCIGDGIALMLVLLALTDCVTEVPPEGRDGADWNPENPFTDLFRQAPRALEAARLVAERIMPEGMKLMLYPAKMLASTSRWLTALGSVEALGRLVLRPPDPKTRFKGPLTVEKRVAWSEALPLPEVKAVGKALGATVNDVLLSAMSGGLHRYLVRSDGAVPPNLSFRAAMPVNLRSFKEMAELGNQFGLIFLGLPVGIADPRERLAELRRRASALKRSAEPMVVLKILKALGQVPLRVQKAVVTMFAAKTTAVMTNVPGPQEVLYLAGRPIRDLFFWVPQSGRVSMGISICSYAGRVRVGVGTDAGLIPDPGRIVEGFQQEYEELRRLALDGGAQDAGAAAGESRAAKAAAR